MDSLVTACSAAAVLVILCGPVMAGNLPSCLPTEPAQTIESATARSGIEDKEVLTRLVYAEGISTGYADDPAVYEAIAWGVMNRVRLSKASASKKRIYGAGIKGVIFKAGQFNPAVSKKSRFSREFLCPADTSRWNMAEQAAIKAIRGEGNPFIMTPWEKKHGLSLVVGFYYPNSVQAKSPIAPWEKNKALRFVGDVPMGEKALSPDRVRFYRLTYPPADIKDPSPGN